MRRSWQAIALRLVAVQVEMGVAMEMTKERLAGAIKVGFAQGRVDYTETVHRAFWPSSKGARRARRPLPRVSHKSKIGRVSILV